ncbi:MAG: insulinase family protein [Chloroflexi bacterium]|nr:insulinase family protein [Chloroflexota bacterium]
MRSMRLIASCALIAAVAAGPSPREAGAATAAVSSVLPNGITVVSRQRTGSQVLAIDVAVRAGARYETAQTASATRFLESALVLGTERWPTRDALSRALTSRGGDLAVSAGREIVEVAVTAGQDDADLALDVLHEVLLRSRFDPDDLERERAVILQQVQEHEDEPEDRATDTFFQTIFGDHPLSHLPAGTSEAVEELTVEQLQGYWRERLVGPNVLISVVSGMSPDEVTARLAAALADLPAGPVPAVNYGDVQVVLAQTVDLPLGTDQSHIFVGAQIPGVATEDRAPLRVLNAVLGRSSGRLFTEIRDRRGLAYSTYSAVTQYVDGGLFYVYAGTRPGSADAVLDLVKAELKRVREEPISPTELQNAIGGEIGSRTIAMETSANEALYTARDTMFGIPSRELQAQAIRAVTAADVQRVARTYLDPERLVVVMTRPAGPTDAGGPPDAGGPTDAAMLDSGEVLP